MFKEATEKGGRSGGGAVLERPRPKNKIKPETGGAGGGNGPPRKTGGGDGDDCGDGGGDDDNGGYDEEKKTISIDEQYSLIGIISK